MAGDMVSDDILLRTLAQEEKIGRNGKLSTMRLVLRRASMLAMLWMLLLHVPAVGGNSIYVVGYNDYGQLGLGDYLQRSTQTKMVRKYSAVPNLGCCATLQLSQHCYFP